MGHYTWYDLDVLNENEFSESELKRASQRLAELMEMPDRAIGRGPFEWLSDGEMKWYDHDSDMTTLAHEFPNMLFKLNGTGEDTGDWWNNYYQGARSFSQGWHWDCAPAWTQVRTKPKEVLR